MQWELIDVGGSFKRFQQEAPKKLKQRLYAATQQSRIALAERMRALAPVGPDAPHMRDAIEVRGTQVGIFDPEQAAVALYNEYRPNRQPFMRPAAMDEDSALKARATKALKQVEADLSL